MKVHALLCFAFLWSSSLFSASITVSDTLNVPSKIKEAVVFTSGAQIQREGKVNVPRGKTILAFRGIAQGINSQSIQVNTKSNVTILSVNHGTRYLGEPVNPIALQDLKDKQIPITIDIRRQQANLAVYKEEEKLLLAHRDTRGKDKDLAANEIQATGVYLRSQLMEVKQKVIDIQLEIEEAEKELNDLKKQEQNLQRGTKGSYEAEIFVAVEAKASGEALFSIRYLQNQAGWFPNYDVRVVDVNNPVNLTYKALVFQSTGEDWNEINLTLSTGTPSQGGTKPNLYPWWLSFYQNNSYAPNSYNNNYNNNPTRGYYNGNQISGIMRDDTGQPLIGASILLKDSSIGVITDVNGRYTLNLPAQHSGLLVVSYVGYETLILPINSYAVNGNMQGGAQLDEVVVSGYGIKKDKRKSQPSYDYEEKYAAPPVPTNQTEGATSTEFAIELPYSVPSDGKQYTVSIANYDLPASFEYFAAPKIEAAAYLTAQVTDWSKLNLLDGEMNLFFEGTYLGKSLLNVSSTEDTLSLSLGKDKNVIVKRERDDKYTGKQFIGNKKTVENAWTIEVRNKKSQAINIKIEDQIPLTSTDEIEVKLIEAKKAKKEDKTGKLVWDLEVQPSSTEKVNFRYSVKYPKAKRLILE